MDEERTEPWVCPHLEVKVGFPEEVMLEMSV